MGEEYIELQKMYEHQEMRSNTGYEYIVRGAETYCSYGSQCCVLNLPNDHGVTTSDERPLITVSDCKAVNIESFGYCKLKKKECIPELSNWTYNQGDKLIKNRSTQKLEYAVVENAKSICKKGGVVKFNTSGQTSPDSNGLKVEGAIEVSEDVSKTWSKGSDNKDFIGHINVKNAGIYNFGINIVNNINLYQGGTAFLYESSGGKLKLLGAYEIKTHTDIIKDEFSTTDIKIYDDEKIKNSTSQVYWKRWFDLALRKNVDYYIEIDMPNIYKFEYKLVGNKEKAYFKNVGAVKWTLSTSNELLLESVYRQNIAIKKVIYLDEDYTMLLYLYLLSIISEEKRKNIIANTAFNTLRFAAVTLFGIVDTKLGIASSITDMFALEYVSKTEAEHLCDSISQFINGVYDIKPVKLIIAMIYPLGLGKNNSEELTNNKQAVSWNINEVVYGEKYYYGHMETMRKIEVIKHLKEAMEQFNQSMQQDIDIIDIIDIQ
jgi:hypothetical protein